MAPYSPPPLETVGWNDRNGVFLIGDRQQGDMVQVAPRRRRRSLAERLDNSIRFWVAVAALVVILLYGPDAGAVIGQWLSGWLS